MAFVYLLRCADGSYYAGSTHDLDRRVWQHNNGILCRYTSRRGRRPVSLVWSYQAQDILEAYLLEKRIQGWGRAKREALISGEVDLLSGLSKKDFGRTSVADAYPPIEAPVDKLER